MAKKKKVETPPLAPTPLSLDVGSDDEAAMLDALMTGKLKPRPVTVWLGQVVQIKPGLPYSALGGAFGVVVGEAEVHGDSLWVKVRVPGEDDNAQAKAPWFYFDHGDLAIIGPPHWKET